MQSNRGRDTVPEVALRSAFHRAGLRFFKNRRPITGMRAEVDVIFPRVKLAVFLDGCYWHGCPEHATAPVLNAEWWRQKLAGNRARDKATTEHLRSRGWTVLRIWEHEDATSSAERVRLTVEHLRSRPGGIDPL